MRASTPGAPTLLVAALAGAHERAETAVVVERQPRRACPAVGAGFEDRARGSGCVLADALERERVAVIGGQREGGRLGGRAEGHLQFPADVGNGERAVIA